MTTEERRRPAVGGQVRRWRTERGDDARQRRRADRPERRLPVADRERQGVPVAQPAWPSLGDALDVPIAWFFIDDVPPPGSSAPPSDRSTGTTDSAGSRASTAATAATCRSSKGRPRPAGGRALHAHAGDEHHFVLRGRLRMSQGDHVVELGPGDYLRWDGIDPARRRGHRRRGGPHPDRDPPVAELSDSSVRRRRPAPRPAQRRGSGGPTGRT